MGARRANGLTAREEAHLIRLLGKVNPKSIGTPLFKAMAEKSISSAIEAVCLRLKTTPVEGEVFGVGDKAIIIHDHSISRVQVYLTQRAADDPAYPGQWHCPGSVMRPGEEEEGVFARLDKKEFYGGLKPKRFVDRVNHPTEARGHFLSMVWLCELAPSEGQTGKWFSVFPVNQLPENTVATHRYRIIPVALGAFLAECSQICE